MKLHQIKAEEFLSTPSDTIIRRGVRKIYYVFQGRNAWHSTWITQYNNGCMHINLDNAKKYAESLRACGSVFYIREIPALII